jgi:hypothetical protein
MLEGPCIRETLESLLSGTYSKPLTVDALRAIRSQSEGFIGSIVEIYTKQFGAGEVGSEAAAKVVNTGHTAEAPTGLLYGRVQSGKTAAMIVTTALAIDNGFRVIVVLTSNNLELVTQTAKRFRAVDGPRVECSTDKTASGYMWEQNRNVIRGGMSQRGVVFVCAKEDDHLKALIHFLQEIGARDLPALIMDDEADHATPNTNLRRQSKRLRDLQRGKRRKDPEIPTSTTFRLVVWNDDPTSFGQSLRQVLPHNVFLQVTATPYALLLQNADSPLRPGFPAILQAGEGYTGGERFFAEVEEGKPSRPPLCYVEDNEATILLDAPPPPEGLLKSAAFFLLAAMSHRLATGQFPETGYKHLSHTSPKTGEHTKLSGLLTTYVEMLLRDFERDQAQIARRLEMAWAYKELNSTVKDLPPLNELLATLKRYLGRFDVLTINSLGQKLTFREKLTFVVGGNILGRGITIDDLLVTYYLRQSKVTQMDTMHQHARMYGYREAIMPYTRLFLPFILAARFARIHENDRLLRNLLITKPGAKPHLSIGLDLRATRPGVMDVEHIRAYGPRQQVYNEEPVYLPQRTVSLVTGRINQIMTDAGFTLTKKVESLEYKQVELSSFQKLIELVPVRPGSGDWDSGIIQRCLEQVAEQYKGRGFLGYREMRRSKAVLPTGAMSGEELKNARGKGLPVMCLFRVKPKGASSDWNGEFWYPVIVFPESMPAIVFNRSEA